MDDHRVTRAVPSLPPSTVSSDEPMNGRGGTEAEIAECAKIMLGAFRMADADDPDIYVGHIRRVLSQYPFWVAKKAATRVPDELKWLPAPQEVREVCEAIYAPYVRERQRQDRITQQLTERSLPKPLGRKQTYEEFCLEMKQRGMPVRKQDQPWRDVDIEAFKAKEGITDETWEQIPDGDCKFKKLR